MNKMAQQANGLPAGWVWTTIGEVAETMSGGTPSRKRPEYFGGDVAWVKSGELRDGVVVDVEETISVEGLRDSSAKVFPRDTALVALYGATVGKTAILGIDAATNQAVCAIFPRNGSFIPKYMTYWLRSQRDELVSLSAGGAQPNISQGIVKAFPFPLAPLPEQHRIVAEIETQFTRLDAGVAALKRVQAKLRRYKAAVLKAACEGRLMPTEAELARVEGRSYESGTALLARILAERRARWQQANPGKRYVEPKGVDGVGLADLPEGWVWASLEELSTHIVDCLHSTPKFVEQGKLCVDTNCIEPGRIVFDRARYVDEHTFQDRIRRLSPQVGDVLFSREGTIGTALVVPENVELCLGQRMMMFRPCAGITSDYFMYAMLSQRFEEQWKPKVVGTTAPHVNIGDLRVMGLPMPPLAEQHRIVAEVERRLSVAQEVESTVAASLKRAERLRQSILKRAFEGRLVAQDPNDEPARMLLERLKTNR